MGRTRIRWQNLGRIAAAIGACGLLVAALPALLEPPEPEQLPPDVGLATGATGAGDVAPAAPVDADRRERGGQAPEPHRTARRDGHVGKRDRATSAPRERRDGTPSPDRTSQPAVVGGSTPPPTLAGPAPPPALPPASSPPPSTPAPAPAAESPYEQEFGFEP